MAIAINGNFDPAVVEKLKKYYGHWDVSKYEHVVENVLTRLLSTGTGQAVVANLPKDLVIVPYPDPGVKNARSRAFPLDSAPKGTPVYDGKQCTDGIVGIGTGKGSVCVLEFTPLVFAAAGTSPAEACSAADQVLCHEMVHSMRQMAAAEMCIPISGFDNSEELVAITVTNVLASETGRSLRKDHNGAQVWKVGNAKDASLAFYRRHRAIIDQMLEVQGAFVMQIAKVNAAFNPFPWCLPGQKLSDKELADWSSQADAALKEALISP